MKLCYCFDGFALSFRNIKHTRITIKKITILNLFQKDPLQIYINKNIQIFYEKAYSKISSI